MAKYKIYVKTHNKTGLKYLGKTTAIDVHKYKGSGVYWTRHLKKHGCDYTTEIIHECNDKLEVIYWGKHYSSLWNVVDSIEWANLKEESGDGGDMSMVPGWRESLRRRRHGRKPGEFTHSDATKAKIKESRSHQIILPHTPESKEKISAALKGKNRKSPSDETKEKLRKRPQCHSNLERLHNAESRAKMKETKRLNPKPGPNLGKPMSEETKAKMRATKALNKLMKISS